MQAFVNAFFTMVVVTGTCVSAHASCAPGTPGLAWVYPAKDSAEVVVDIDPGVPVTFNDPGLTPRMLPTLRKVYGENNVYMSARVTGAEDFSFYQEEIPGFFFFIGGRPADIPPERAIPNHSPFFTVDEAALVPGVEAMTMLALDYLAKEARWLGR